ncbi:MAG: bifunctional nuclease family protein, partial [Candidatus Omnitrophica bacterium]|nr:bifunctional nuclease family protein [Candidatus Omnitrophota bacterium]
MEQIKEAKIFSLVLIPMLGQYVVTLEEIGGVRLVPIWIGMNEGNAIMLKIQNEQLPRPMTHDLLVNILNNIDLKIEKVVISDLRDDTYYAIIYLIKNGQKIEIDSRPSDALAIAVRANSPIFINDKVFQKCPVIKKPITDQEVEEFKKNIQSLKPED